MTLLSVLFVMFVSPGFLTEDTKVMLRLLARTAGCTTPSIAAEWNSERSLMEVRVTCLKPGEDDP